MERAKIIRRPCARQIIRARGRNNRVPRRAFVDCICLSIDRSLARSVARRDGAEIRRANSNARLIRHYVSFSSLAHDDGTIRIGGPANAAN